MREIKFRAWAGWKMFYPEDNEFILTANGKQRWLDSETGEYDSTGQEKLMQYTGLKDKNGKEIYEGDIMKYPNEIKAIVEWKNDLGSCGCCYDLFSGTGFVNVHSEYEVIGNIYENPDLIKNQ